MILPQSVTGALMVMILGMLCLGLWANLLKMSGGTRFELFYFDFAIGVVIAAVIYGFTVGNMGFDGFSLLDDLSKAGKRQWVWAFLAGIIVNLGNMLLTASISVAGMSVAFPVALGVALLGSVLIGLGSSNPLFLIAGCVLIVAAMVTCVLARSMQVSQQRDELRKEGKLKRGHGPTTVKGLLLALFGGILLRAATPLLTKAGADEIGLGPYALTVLFSGGLLFSTFVFCLFFMNLPVEGEPLEVMDILKPSLKQHLQGMVAGVIWCTGFLALLVAGAVDHVLQVSPGVHLSLSHASAVVAALCGLLVWKEFAGSPGAAKGLAFGSLLLFTAGLAAMSMAV